MSDFFLSSTAGLSTVDSKENFGGTLDEFVSVSGALAPNDSVSISLPASVPFNFTEELSIPIAQFHDYTIRATINGTQTILTADQSYNDGNFYNFTYSANQHVDFNIVVASSATSQASVGILFLLDNTDYDSSSYPAQELAEFSGVSLKGASPAVLTVTPSSQSRTVSLTEGPSGTITTSAQTGTISFADTDTAATPFISSETFTVSAKDSHGNTVTLNAAQISLLESEFSYNLPSTNSNNGSINWTYSPQGLNFLAAGETAVVTPALTVADQDGNSQTATVAFTVNGAVSNFKAGFDTAYYPGATSMQWLKSNTNLQWVDYYLTPAPSQGNVLGWMGTRATLQAQGWLLEPIYVGRQAHNDPTLSSNLSFIENAPHPPTQQGVIDGDCAAAKMTSEGFSKGTTVYLDIESAGTYVKQNAALQAYISSWCSEVTADGYSAGVYCLSGAASTILQLDRTATLMIANTSSGGALAANIDETSTGGYVFPEAAPSGSGVVKNVSSWQYDQHFDLINSTNSSAGLNTALLQDVDIDTLTSAPQTRAIVADFTGTGTSDIFMVDYNTGTMREWLMSNGQISQAPSPGGAAANLMIVGSGDFNGDGTSDLFWQNIATGAIGEWQISNGQISAAPSLGNLSASQKLVAIGDFNGDGTSDIFWQNASNAVGEWVMSNGQIRSAPTLGSTPAGFQILGSGDFNGDGTSDIFWENNSGVVGEWLMSNGNIGAAPSLGNTAAGFQIVGFGDFTGDGTSDVLWHDSNSSTVGYWLMSNGLISKSVTLGSVSPTLQYLGTGQYTGDGTQDVLWRDSASGTTGEWVMSNGLINQSITLGTVASNWSINPTTLAVHS